MSISWAIYLLVCKELGNNAPFPGSQVFLNHPDDISYSPSIADMSVWATTNEHTKDQDFNHASGDPVVFKYFWRELAAYFGIQVNFQSISPPVFPIGLHVGQIDEVEILNTSAAEWMKDKRPVWERIVEKRGGRLNAFEACNWHGLEWADRREWPIFPSVTKARRYGWSRVDTASECWFGSFKAFENAGILPRPV